MSRTIFIKIGVGVVFLGVLVAGGIALVTYLSQRSVTFTLSSTTDSVIIRDATSEDYDCVKDCSYAVHIELEESGTVRLADGEYLAIPSGDTIAIEPIAITVTKDSTNFSIDPEYSQDHLGQLLESEMPLAHQTLLKAYPFLEQYHINEGVLYKHGDWYVTSLLKNTEGANVDIYYTVLQKVNGTWRVVGTPSLYFAYSEYPTIPEDILYTIHAGTY